MKTLTFSIQQSSIKHVNKIKTELNNIGICKFDIDFYSKEINISCPFSIQKNNIECALQKAGLKCKCISF